MARALGLLPAALLAARAQTGANAFYRTLRDLNVAPRRSEALAIYKAAVEITSKSGTDVFNDLSQNPAQGILAPWPSKNSTSVVQNVTLIYRDRTTGAVAQTYYRVSTPNGVTRSEAISKAITAYSGTTEEYKQDLIGALHTSAYQMTPAGF